MEFFRQEYWSGLTFPSLGDLPDPGIEPVSFASPALTGSSLPLSHLRSPFIHLSCVVLRGMAHNVIELDKPVIHVIRLVSFL